LFKEHTMRQTQTAFRQRGQALVFILAFAAATGLAVLLLFNSGKLANTKTDLQNAADAGAYAAATLQARDHNFSAYTNRAMIANQVAVAQFVSLKSYLDDAAETRSRMDNMFFLFYELFPSSKPRWDMAKDLPIPEARNFIDNLAPLAVTGLDLLIDALMEAQQVHHLATMSQMLSVADDVVKKNDPDAQVTKGAFTLGNTMVSVTQWGGDLVKGENGYTTRHRANTAAAEADRFADAVLDSLDGFTPFRSGIPAANWGSSVNIYMCYAFLPGFMVYDSSSTMFSFVHGGGTVLSGDKKRWLALDATMGTGFATCTYWYPTFWGIEYDTAFMDFPDIGLSPPFFGGNAGAVAGQGDYDWPGYHGNPLLAYGSALQLPLAQLPAGIRYAEGPGGNLDSNGKGGLQDYYRDITNYGSTPQDQTPERNGGPAVTIEVERPVDASLRLSSTLLSNARDVRLNDAANGPTKPVLRTVASGQAYFYRPKNNGSEFTRDGWQRADDKTEMANLFSPYWQARLMETPPSDAAASLTLQPN
jgi:hypothetical protein